MSDFESFGGFDAGRESFDPAAFERFKERMKAAAAQLKAIQKQEKKQKKSEDELIKILIKFIKTGKNKEILLLVSRLLEMNAPAAVIVGLLLISNPDIQQQLGLALLPSGETEKQVSQQANLPDLYIGGAMLPLKVKIAMVSWVNEINKKVNDHPHRTIKTLIDENDQVHLTAVQLGSFCLRDFLEEQGVPHEYDQLKEFVRFFLSDIIGKAREELKNRKEIE
ncbi:MAG: hypothetical protein R3B71_02335 [Candidatus Gracilibacteria bacterium]|nr:hypothetical protein [Candidatus Peregrinibacteria bacterium]